MGGTECGSERAVLAPSARGVFRALIAAVVDRRCSRCDRINLRDSGSCRKEALERHSEALHIGRCEGRAVRHERDILKIRLEAIGVNAFLEAHRAIGKFKRSTGGVNARRPCGTHGRSAAESVEAAEHRMRIETRWAFNSASEFCGNQGER